MGWKLLFCTEEGTLVANIFWGLSIQQRTNSAFKTKRLWPQLEAHPAPGSAALWMLGRALTRHEDDLGLVVWVPIRGGLGQVLNSHFILLARIYHKVAEGKPPLRKRGDGMGHTMPSPIVCKVPVSHLPANRQTNTRLKG